eukprot:3965839-Pyramimonas_sp.AAC.1
MQHGTGQHWTTHRCTISHRAEGGIRDGQRGTKNTSRMTRSARSRSSEECSRIRTSRRRKGGSRGGIER